MGRRPGPARSSLPIKPAEINAGRGAALAVGPSTLCEPLEALGYATVFAIATPRRERKVRLAVVAARSERARDWPAEFELLRRRMALSRAHPQKADDGPGSACPARIFG